MNRFLFFAILGAALFYSCVSGSGRQISDQPAAAGSTEESESYVITDYKNRDSDDDFPEWVSCWLAGGDREVETLDAYQDLHVFVSRNGGNNFYALNQWLEGFSPELDFPRLAAARIEARFLSSAPYPDDEYGSFFLELIRAASDAVWTGAVREENFWMLQKFFTLGDDLPGGDLITEENWSGSYDEDWQDSYDSEWPGASGGQASAEPALPPEDFIPARETWVFLILVTMEKNLFSSQFDEVFSSVRPNPLPTRDQVNVINRVKERFFDGF